MGLEGEVMSKLLTLAFAITAASAGSAFAGFSATPEFGPIPEARPTTAIVEAADQPLPANVVAIGVEPQDVPASRQHVRVVGWKFLPDASEEIAIAGRVAPADSSAAVKTARLKPAAAEGTSVVAELFGVGQANAGDE